MVRTSGGHNAGHTIVVERREVRHPPAAQRHPHPGATSVIANGVVVSPEALFRELDALVARGVDGRRPRGQRQRARHRVVPLHDRQGHRAVPGQEQDRHHRPRHRPGVRRQDQPHRHPDRRPLRRGHPAPEGRGARSRCKNHLLAKVYNRRAIEVDAVVEELLSYVERLRPMVADTSLLLNQALDRGETVLFEGAQATMLDVDHGTYPFVTSSQPGRRRGLHRRGRRPDPDRPGDRRDQGVHDPGRLRAVPDRAVRRRRRGAPQDRRRVRRLHRPDPPLRLVRRGGGALRQPGQRAHRLLPHQARRARRAGSGSRSAWPTRSTACGTTRCR